MAKAQNGKTWVHALVHCLPYWDGGDDLLSLHRTRDGAKDARAAQIASGKYTSYDLAVEKYELED
jgi:hypothetical protein